MNRKLKQYMSEKIGVSVLSRIYSEYMRVVCHGCIN
jgi:hypothetical protein